MKTGNILSVLIFCQLQTEKQKGRFIAFEVKKDMRIAPLIRVDEKTQEEKVARIDNYFHSEVWMNQHSTGCNTNECLFCCQDLLKSFIVELSNH